MPASLTELSAKPSQMLIRNKHRVATIESTTAGLIGASLVATPGATGFYISSCVVYSGRGYKQHLPQEILEQSKRRFVKEVSLYMREKLRADWIVVESGTVGPTFYIPGVENAFTAIGIVGPGNNKGTVSQWIRIVETTKHNREENMWDFTKAALDMLRECIEEYESMAKL